MIHDIITRLFLVSGSWLSGAATARGKAAGFRPVLDSQPHALSMGHEPLTTYSINYLIDYYVLANQLTA